MTPAPETAALVDLLGDAWVVIYQGRYWRPNGGGYTDTMLMAGLYSEADAKRIERESDRGDHAHRALDHVGERGTVYCDENTLIGRALAASLLSRPPQPEPQGTASDEARAKAILAPIMARPTSEIFYGRAVSEIASALAGERAFAMDCALAEAKDCGCGHKIAAAIRAGGQEG